MRKGVILALDTSAMRTGMAVGAAGDGLLVVHSCRFGGHGEDIGALLCAFRRWLTDQVRRDDPQVIAFEQPVRPFANANLVTMRQLYGITGMVEVVGKDLGVRTIEVNTQTMKATFYGRGGKKPKFYEAREAAQHWGFDVDNMDEADAVGVWVTALKYLYPEEFEARSEKRYVRRAEQGAALL